MKCSWFGICQESISLARESGHVPGPTWMELGKHPQWEDNGPTKYSKYSVCGEALLALNSAFLRIRQYKQCGAGKHKRLTEQNNL